ncbi:MAG: hypothetical protein FJ098_07205 [Deltaproteobacteria bacterium]|nr:hypothetical protein [Deltaproteobacteria bacterium]
MRPRPALLLLTLSALLPCPPPAAAQTPPTQGGEALLFGAGGLPFLLGRAGEKGLLLEVVGEHDQVIATATVPGCSLEKLRMDLGNRSTGCLPQALLREHGLQGFPLRSLACTDLTGMIEVIPDRVRMTVRLQLASGPTILHEQELSRREAFPVVVRWHEGCGRVVVSHAGSEVSKAFTRSATLPENRTRIPGPARGRSWLEQGERLWEEGEWSDARLAAGEAVPLLQATDELQRAALLLSRLGLHREALETAGRVAAKDAATGARLLAAHELRESRLATLDLSSAELVFKAPKGFEGTTIWVKVKDAKDTSVAAFKPTSGNTYHRGEVFTWRMARLLGIEDIYPVTALVTLDKRGCDKLVTALREVTYKGPKEVNRQRIIRACREGSLEGALKEWVQAFQFFGGIGTVKRLKGHAIFKHLTRKGARPAKGAEVPVTQKTKLYKPDHCREATYRGSIDQDLLARDLSDLLVMDVLNANEDRFPGANVEFKSLAGTARETKPCVFDFGPSRLFSLDNGGTFKGAAYRSWDDLAKNLQVSRFNRRTFLRLQALQAFVQGKAPAPVFVRRAGVRSLDDLWRFLALDRTDGHRNRKKPPFNLFKTNLKRMVDYMAKLKDDKYAWF